MAPKAPPDGPSLIDTVTSDDDSHPVSPTSGLAAKNSGKPSLSSPSESTTSRPWYARGGMAVNEIGMAVNIAWPAYVIWKISFADAPEMKQAFIALLVLSWILAFVLHGMRTIFCVLVIPTYLPTLLFAFSLYSSGQTTTHPALLLFASLMLTVAKVGICMSVCLHRFAAHAAFKCSYVMQVALNILGCMANQGGPIWWASMHRAHHKYCDGPKDPHSAFQDGTEKAVAFFETHPHVDEQFAPRHNDTYLLRVLDTFSCVVVGCELFLWYKLGGPTGLFMGYTSAWLCQTMTLWFNVAAHPEAVEKECKAADYKGSPKGWYPGFLLLDFFYPFFCLFVGEKNHANHHKHFALAKRGWNDMAYWTFVWPLEKVGLIWNVKTLPTTE